MTWILIALVLVLLFSAISITAALRRIAVVTEQSARHLESLDAQQRADAQHQTDAQGTPNGPNRP
ncbi:hypothetical protein SAMN04489806_0948 [Paramicrobacterium humi]|uniref:Uncharacterized protein n=1 Tax=Paramicrobacterium humi TaxID=640635 RepID=A0A1H4K031_9MICO|nr:hypothetical protein SAMN04489806_0948 [Microbacterium humi]